MDKFSPTPEMPESVRDVIDRARALGSLSGFALDSWLGTLAATAFDAGRQSVSSERGEFTVDEICLMIQNAVSDYTRRTPGHLRDCDMLTGHIVHAFRNAAPQVLAMATSGASGQNVEVDRAGRPSGVSPALCDERPAGGSNPAGAASQEPVAWRWRNPGGDWWYRDTAPTDADPQAQIEPLYGLPWVTA